MNKHAFNKENPVDLFSQLVKVLSKKNTENRLDDSIQRLKQLSSEVFKSLKERQIMSNIEKVADDIISTSKTFKMLGRK
jgi:hypothetical protein